MPGPSRRHTNADFANNTGLLLAELGLLGIMAFIFIGNIQSWYDKGILERMPYYNYEVSSDTLFIPASHILHLDLIVENQIYCEGKRIELIQLENRVNNHLYRAIDKDTSFFVSLHSERAATYQTYLAIKDVVLTQQKDRLNELSLQIFGEPYSAEMHVARKRILRQQLELGLLEWTLNDSGPQLVETRNGLW